MISLPGNSHAILYFTVKTIDVDSMVVGSYDDSNVACSMSMLSARVTVNSVTQGRSQEFDLGGYKC